MYEKVKGGKGGAETRGFAVGLGCAGGGKAAGKGKTSKSDPEKSTLPKHGLVSARSRKGGGA